MVFTKEEEKGWRDSACVSLAIYRSADFMTISAALAQCKKSGENRSSPATSGRNTSFVSCVTARVQGKKSDSGNRSSLATCGRNASFQAKGFALLALFCFAVTNVEPVDFY